MHLKMSAKSNHFCSIAFVVTTISDQCFFQFLRGQTDRHTDNILA